MYYRKLHGFLVAPQQPWQWRQMEEDHGVSFEAWGKWDGGWRSAIAAMVYGDYDMLEVVADCLVAGRRWPVGLDHPEDFQDVYKVTRDPHNMFWCAAYLMDRKQFIKVTPMPFWRRSPHTQAFRRWLLNPTRFNKWVYERFELINLRFRHKMFSLSLAAWRCYVVDSDRCKHALHNHKLGWYHKDGYQVNWLLLALTDTDGYLKEHWSKTIAAYKSRNRFQWGEDVWRPGDLLPYGEQYYFDKDTLNFVLDR